MADIKVNDKIQAVLEMFGMSGKKAAEAMGISYGVFRLNRLDTDKNHFSEQHYAALVKYIKSKAAEL